MISKQTYFLWCFLFFLISVILIFHLQRLYYGCVNVADFSIYQQGAYEITWKNLNPYLTIRNIKVFNDHFDPGLLLMALWGGIWGNSGMALLIGEWLILVGLLFFIAWAREEKPIANKELWVAWAFFLFSRGILQAFEFPIHPSTWGILPITMLFYCIIKRYTWWTIFLALAVCQFRESFYFAILSLSFFFLINKRKKEFIGTFIIGVMGIIFLFYYRTKLLGPVINYAGHAKQQLIQNHIFFIWKSFVMMKWPLKIFLPLLIPTVILLIRQKNKKLRDYLESPILAASFFSAPIVGLHVLAQFMAHHHMAPMVTPFLAIFAFSDLPQFLLRKKALGLFIFFTFIFTCSSRYSRMIEFIALRKWPNCAITREKRLALDELQKVMKDINPLLQGNKYSMISTPGVVANILHPGMNLYQISTNVKILSHYDYLLLEQNQGGDIYPLSWNEASKIKEKCRAKLTKEILNNKYFLLWKGKFNDDCLELSTRWQYHDTYIK